MYTYIRCIYTHTNIPTNTVYSGSEMLLSGKALGVDEICHGYLKSLDVVSLSCLQAFDEGFGDSASGLADPLGCPFIQKGGLERVFQLALVWSNTMHQGKVGTYTQCTVYVRFVPRSQRLVVMINHICLPQYCLCWWVRAYRCVGASACLLTSSHYPSVENERPPP